MEIRVEVTKESYIKATTATFIYFYQRFLLVMIIISILFTIYYVATTEQDYSLGGYLVTFFSYFTFLLVLSIIVGYIRLYKKFKAAVNEIGDRILLQKFTLHDDGITIVSTKTNGFLKWSEFRKVYQLPDYICLMLRKRLVYAIPKSAFASKEDEQLFFETTKRSIPFSIRGSKNNSQLFQ
jgi:hypothetical protein